MFRNEETSPLACNVWIDKVDIRGWETYFDAHAENFIRKLLNSSEKIYVRGGAAGKTSDGLEDKIVELTSEIIDPPNCQSGLVGRLRSCLKRSESEPEKNSLEEHLWAYCELINGVLKRPDIDFVVEDLSQTREMLIENFALEPVAVTNKGESGRWERQIATDAGRPIVLRAYEKRLPGKHKGDTFLKLCLVAIENEQEQDMGTIEFTNSTGGKLTRSAVSTQRVVSEVVKSPNGELSILFDPEIAAREFTVDTETWGKDQSFILHDAIAILKEIAIGKKLQDQDFVLTELEKYMTPDLLKDLEFDDIRYLLRDLVGLSLSLGARQLLINCLPHSLAGKAHLEGTCVSLVDLFKTGPGNPSGALKIAETGHNPATAFTTALCHHLGREDLIFGHYPSPTSLLILFKQACN